MPVEIRVPTLGESVVEATVGRWLKQQGEPVKVGEPLVELETDKVNVEVPADAAGVLESAAATEGSTVKPGDVLGTISTDGSAAAAPAPAPAKETAAAEAPGPNGQDEVRVSPLAERVAEDLGIDLARVQGTGPGHRITREDVQAAAEQRAPSAAGDAPGAAPQAPSPAVRPPAAPAAAPAASAGSRPETRQRLSRRRLTIATRLVEAQHTAAMLTTFNEVDMTSIMAMRSKWRDTFKEQHGVGLGFMSFFTKAVVGALKAFPQINAELQGEELILKQYYDIGIAIGDKEGLVVPVVRNADRLTFAEIEKAIAGFVEKSKNRALSISDLQGGTFTITNGGVFGSLLSTPILNPPQVGILGMHKIEERAVVVNKEVVVRPMMYLALSYDHRVVDGREAVQFLVRVKELLENPERLLLEG